FANVQVADICPTRPELLVGTWVGSEQEWPYWIVPLPGGSPRRLDEIVAHDARWSPDGQQIVYARGSELSLAESDGSHSRKLVTGSGFPAGPRWSPDGGVLCFTLIDPNANSTSLWQVQADGTQLRPLLPGWNTPPAESSGRWSPDGKYFLFHSCR